ncbi:MAG: hypothetical protein N2C13_03905, partial [Chloroflexota bacterium]
SLEDNGYTHLFAYQPETTPLLRLTVGEWDDIHPSLSPDGNYIAFSSHRNGQWDIYVMELSTGQTRQITDDLVYDGSPDWSPDGNWLVYETYVDNNLDIAIVPLDGSELSSRLTNNLSADFSPRWAPQGRQIAFTSNRDGTNDIWTLDLDKIGDDRFENITRNPTQDQHSPEWFPGGDVIAWSSEANGVRSVYSRSANESKNVKYHGFGSSPIWNPDGTLLLALSEFHDSTYYSIYSSVDGKLLLPATELPGRIEGVSWGKNSLPKAMPNYILEIFSEMQISSSEDNQGSDIGAISGRQFTIDLANVEAPFPQLNALAIGRFYELRDRISNEAGWDVLSSLENAFVPITNRLEPGREKDWLYTGRAFTLPPVLLDIGWMSVAMEQYNGRTYWRVYIRASVQDGSMGRPLYDFPWDFNARFTGNATYYEQGGAPASRIPTGYWVDITAIAIDIGWERLSALYDWQYLFHSARFNEFVLTSGLDWEQAILQLYPPEILSTPQPVTR